MKRISAHLAYLLSVALISVYCVGIPFVAPMQEVYAVEDGVFLESGGKVCIEAERAMENSVSAFKTARNSHDWSEVTGLAGSALDCTPDNGSAWTDTASLNTNNPELTYKISFATEGSYNVWILCKGIDYNSDSLYVGVDGLFAISKLDLDRTQFIWSNIGTISGITAGDHYINIWAREDGLKVDKIYLTTGTEMPSGTGPAESFRQGEPIPTPTSTPTPMPPQPDIPCIPDIKGFGVNTPGGRYGQIVHVTNLNPSGPGSLREACEMIVPRTVVFDVAGVIDLPSGGLVNNTCDIKIRNPYITIAGQTAPAPGITLKGGTLQIRTHDAVIQHLRFRIGTETLNGPDNADGISITADYADVYNIVVDHCSTAWAMDELVQIWGKGHRLDNITITNSIFAEALRNTGHPSGEHGFGALVSNDAKNIALIGNLQAHTQFRGPMVKAGATLYNSNNVWYNSQWAPCQFGSSDGDLVSYGQTAPAPILASYIGNSYLLGPNSRYTSPVISVIDGSWFTGTKIYNQDNIFWDPSNWIIYANPAHDASTDVAPVTVQGHTPVPASQVEAYVAQHAGAWPAYRDDTDWRAVITMQNRTGGIIDVQPGYPVVDPVTRVFVEPADPNGDSDGDGYTNLEEVMQQMAVVAEALDPNQIPTITPLPTPTPTPTPSPTPTPIPVVNMSNMTVYDTANAADWSMRVNIQPGSVQYGDRTQTLTSVPESVVGCEWIKAANDSKAYTADPLVTFTVTQDAEVYVAHDDRITAKPSWMSGWTDTGEELISSTNVKYSLYKKQYTTDAVVSLGSSGNTTFNVYTVIVKPIAGSTPTPTPTPTSTPVPTPTPVYSQVIANMTVYDAANAADWSAQANMQTGSVQYGDRTQTLTAVPASMAGCEWIKAANDSKAYTADPLVTFTVTQNVEIYVAHDDRITAKPLWMSGWTDTGEELISSTNVKYSLYKKPYAAGTVVSLGNSGHTIFNVYTVIVKPVFSNMTVYDTANAVDWSVQANIQTGSVQYGDRTQTLTAVPASVAGCEWIKTANDSKAYTADPLLTFTVTQDVEVYVAHDDRITAKPSWMSGWTDTEEELISSTNVKYSLYKKPYSAGAVVSLGNSGHTIFNVYTVIVKPVPEVTPTQSSTPTPTPTPILSEAPSLDMIFSMKSIFLSGSSKITGNIGTNSKMADSVAFRGSAVIDGDLFIGPESEQTEVIEGSKPDVSGYVTGDITSLSSARDYPMPEFPEFPELPDKGDLTVGWWPADPVVIDESGSYGSITVNNRLNINVGEADVLIKAGNMTVNGSGSVVVNRTGTGKVVFYVSDRIEVSGSGSINKNGNFEDLAIYYSGGDKLSFGGNTLIAGSIFAKAASVEISGSGVIIGHVITGGGKVSISGNAQMNSRVIYSPDTDLSLAGSSRINGVAVAKSIILAGSSQINYDDSMSLEFFKHLDWGVLPPVPTPIPTPTLSPTPMPTPGSGQAITQMIVYDATNAADWSMQTNIQLGSLQYGDRSQTLTAVPASAAGCEWIKAANDSKAYTADPLVTFTLTQDAQIYIAFDDRIISRPLWLSDWTDTGEELISSTNVKYSLYKKQYAAGAVVSLGSLGNTVFNVYTVIVKPL